MYKPFFPTPEFAWGFVIVLIAGLAVASYVDQKRRVIPKSITLSLFGAGVLSSIARGANLGYQAQDLWIVATNSGWLGALDGLLFALSGALAGFAVLFVFWILGTCGGGDVKLFTALGAWLGPYYSLYVLLVSFVGLFVIVAIKAVTRGVIMKAIRQSGNRPSAFGETDSPLDTSNWRISYSLPVTIATLAVLIWAFGAELHLTGHSPKKAEAVAHAR
jgi:prepilin peptidase CpaA